MCQLLWNLHLHLNRSLKCLMSKKITKSQSFLKQLRKKQLLNLKSQSLKTKPLDLLSNFHLRLSINLNIRKLMNKLPSTSSMKKNPLKLKYNLSSNIMNRSLKRSTTCMQLPSTKSLNTMMRSCTHMLQPMRNKQYSKWYKM